MPRVFIQAFGVSFGPVAAVGVLAGWAVLTVGANRDLVAAYDRHYRDSVPNSNEIARVIDDASSVFDVPVEQVYLLGAANWTDHRNVAFALHDPAWGDTNHIWADAPLPVAPSGSAAIFVIKIDDEVRLAQLERAYPEGVALLVDSDRNGKDFLLFVTDGTLPLPDELAGVPILPFAESRDA